MSLDLGYDNVVTPVATLGSGANEVALAKQRRRGAELEDAIRAAALAELAEVGYAALTVEAVAARAQTGKASIYRRWESKAALLLDAFCLRGAQQCTPDMQVSADASTEQAVKIIARRVAAVLAGEAGAIMRELAVESARDPHLAETIDRVFHRPRREAMLGLLRRGVARGEVRPGAVNDAVADVLPALLLHRIVWLRRRVSEEELDGVVENVLLPLVRP